MVWMKDLYGGITLATEGWMGKQEGTDIYTIC